MQNGLLKWSSDVGLLLYFYEIDVYHKRLSSDFDS